MSTACFSFIILNWKGRPLVSYETVVNLIIGATRTKTGLRIKAALDTREYEAGVKISDEQMERINLRPHSTNPFWNYTISPRVILEKVKPILWSSLSSVAGWSLASISGVYLMYPTWPSRGCAADPPNERLHQRTSETQH